MHRFRARGTAPSLSGVTDCASRAQSGRRWLAASIAPGNPLPGRDASLHAAPSFLLRELGFEIVATSGNLSDEPICIDEHEAVERLGGIADGFLVHDRPIVRHVDDSVVRVMRDRELVLRRARGYAPLPVHLKDPLPCVLAVGAHLKNSVALSVGTEVFVSQHIGDLGTNQAFQAFRRVSEDLLQLYAATPAASPATCILITCRPSMPASSRRPRIRSSIIGRMFFLAWPRMKSSRRHWAFRGTARATEPTERFGAVNSSLPGAARSSALRGSGNSHSQAEKQAIRQPSRTALGVLFEIWGEGALGRRDVSSVRDFLDDEIRVIRQMLARGLNAPVTSSAGRFFDAVASLIGLRHRTSFEGQAAMELEFAVAARNERVLRF